MPPQETTEAPETPPCPLSPPVPCQPHDTSDDCLDDDDPVTDLDDIGNATVNSITREPPSRNVTLTLAYTAWAFAGRSIWQQSVLATWVFLLQGKLQDVGYVTAIMGISQLVVSIPAGFLADTYRRDTLLRTASAVGLLAIATTLLACHQRTFHCLVIALAVWGCCWGIANTALSALFADSIRDGERSYYFTQRSVLITLGNTTGPIVALVLFKLLGDHWTIQDCAAVMAVGQIVCFPAIVLLCFLSDDYIPTASDAVDPPDETEPARDAFLPAGTPANPVDTNQALTQPLLAVDTVHTPVPYVYGFLPPTRAVPILVALADILSGLGSGMSIRYFPIFFVQNLGLGPVHVQLLYITAPLLQANLMRLAQTLATQFGRCRVSVAFKCVGVAFMFLMIASYHWHLPTFLVCTLYILRTSCMNATSALTRSILMDNVPPHERGKWSALESVNMFSWSGSAFVGGMVIGWGGILPLFIVTACGQLLATLPLVALFGYDVASPETNYNNNGVHWLGWMFSARSVSYIPDSDDDQSSYGSRQGVVV
jgi:MFS family permease